MRFVVTHENGFKSASQTALNHSENSLGPFEKRQADSHRLLQTTRKQKHKRFPKSLLPFIIMDNDGLPLSSVATSPSSSHTHLYYGHTPSISQN